MLNFFNKKRNKKVYVGLSGGVDSAVSAHLLKKDGYDVTGVFIKTWQPDYIECTWKNDRLDAMRISAQLDIPFATLDLEKEYKENVIDYMLNEYAKNNTPNPDIMCNKYIKFDGFLEFAKENNAIIATGHYSKIKNNFLYIPKDLNKDQTYFLYQIKKENLKDIIFPLADLEKSEVKKIARKNNLHVVDKKESMGICMLGDISMKDFLIKELKPKSGDVCNEIGEIIGAHDGVILYTVGERHGFTITKKNNADSGFSNFLKNKKESKQASLPYFVYEKDLERNILYVTQNQNKILEKNNMNNKDGFVLKEVNIFVDLNVLDESKVYDCMTRYRGEKYKVKLSKVELVNKKDKSNNKSIQIKITPIKNNFFAVSGQSSVVYDEGEVLLGGII